MNSNFWNEIVGNLLQNLGGPVSARNLTLATSPGEAADCCGTEFGNHVSWRGLWLPCNPTKKAAWTRKTNREAKLRKRAAAIARSGNPNWCRTPGHPSSCECDLQRRREQAKPPRLRIDSLGHVVDQKGKVVGRAQTSGLGSTIFHVAGQYETFGSMEFQGGGGDAPYRSWLRDAWERGLPQFATHRTAALARRRILDAIAERLHAEAAARTA